MTLHPLNDQVGADGLSFPPEPTPRGPFRYVTEGGDELHLSPLCPEMADQVYYALGAEESLYAVGERYCETCRLYNLTLEDTGWTDPRYRRVDR